MAQLGVPEGLGEAGAGENARPSPASLRVGPAAEWCGPPLRVPAPCRALLQVWFPLSSHCGCPCPVLSTPHEG